MVAQPFHKLCSDAALCGLCKPAQQAGSRVWSPTCPPYTDCIMFLHCVLVCLVYRPDGTPHQPAKAHDAWCGPWPCVPPVHHAQGRSRAMALSQMLPFVVLLFKQYFFSLISYFIVTFVNSIHCLDKPKDPRGYDRSVLNVKVKYTCLRNELTAIIQFRMEKVQ